MDDLTDNLNLTLKATEPYSHSDWNKLLAGAMAGDTAPFAVHPCDYDRACAMVARAAKAGVRKKDIEYEIRNHLAQRVAKGPDGDRFKDKQVQYFRQFFKRKTRSIKRGWVIYKKSTDGKVSIVHLLRSRLTPDKALEAACLIYEATELNSAAKFICAKRNFPKPYPIWQWRIKNTKTNRYWPGEFRIGENPVYVVRMANSIAPPKGFAPNEEIDWQPVLPPDNFPDW